MAITIPYFHINNVVNFIYGLNSHLYLTILNKLSESSGLYVDNVLFVRCLCIDLIDQMMRL